MVDCSIFVCNSLQRATREDLWEEERLAAEKAGGMQSARSFCCNRAGPRLSCNMLAVSGMCTFRTPFMTYILLFFGPSLACLPRSYFHLPFAYDKMAWRLGHIQTFHQELFWLPCLGPWYFFLTKITRETSGINVEGIDVHILTKWSMD